MKTTLFCFLVTIASMIAAYFTLKSTIIYSGYLVSAFIIVTVMFGLIFCYRIVGWLRHELNLALNGN
jgi:hypothetical protein